MIPGLFGNFQVGKTDNEQDDTLLEEQLKGYRFTSHYPDHSIEFSGRNDVGVWDDDAAAQEFETMGDQAYIKKYFIRVMLNDSLYLKWKNNPSVFYKVKEVPEENIILFPLDDGADMITTRIFINHPQSPLKNKPRK
jgi:hypothetical protein